MNYKNHDRLGYTIAASTTIVSTIMGIPAWVTGPVVVGCLIGTVWLSPDLDLHHSKPSQRWGIFQPLWKKYAKKSKHRGLSHMPIIGNMTRVFYFLTRFLGLPLAGLIALCINYPQIIIHLVLLVCGIEVYCISHIMSDHISSLWKRLSR